MTALNKQALREAANAANIASWGKWESYKPHKGARGYEVKVGAKAVAQHCLKVDSAFISAANPAAVLALLDELEAKDRRIEEEIARDIVEECAPIEENACRAAMLQAGNHTEQHLDMVNFPVIPDGYVLVPKEITCAMDDAAWEAYHETRCMSDIWAALLAAAPQQEVESALEHGMRRYAGAMQKLSEGDD